MEYIQHFTCLNRHQSHHTLNNEKENDGRAGHVLLYVEEDNVYTIHVGKEGAQDDDK